MKSTRVIVMLAGGNHGNVYFKTREEAVAYVMQWSDQAKSVMEEPEWKTLPILENRLIASHDDCGDRVSAFLLQGIIGMYIPDDTPKEPTCDHQEALRAELTRQHEVQSRIAAALDNLAEAWRNR